MYNDLLITKIHALGLSPMILRAGDNLLVRHRMELRHGEYHDEYSDDGKYDPLLVVPIQPRHLQLHVFKSDMGYKLMTASRWVSFNQLNRNLNNEHIRWLTSRYHNPVVDKLFVFHWSPMSAPAVAEIDRRYAALMEARAYSMASSRQELK